MQKIATAISSLGLGLLLSSLSACSPPVGPDQQEAGLEKSDAGRAAGSNEDTSKHAVIDAYSRCFDSCADKSADDRPTCHDDCATKISAGDGNPAASACPRSCTKAFGSCLAPCGDKPSEDDVATCRKHCRALAINCVDGCN
jgi:hypothetical protein